LQTTHWKKDNSLDKLRHPRSDAYSAEQVLLNKQQISGGGAYSDCYRKKASQFQITIVLKPAIGLDFSSSVQQALRCNYLVLNTLCMTYFAPWGAHCSGLVEYIGTTSFPD